LNNCFQVSLIAGFNYLDSRNADLIWMRYSCRFTLNFDLLCLLDISSLCVFFSWRSNYFSSCIISSSSFFFLRSISTITAVGAPFIWIINNELIYKKIIFYRHYSILHMYFSQSPQAQAKSPQFTSEVHFSLNFYIYCRFLMSANMENSSFCQYKRLFCLQDYA